nr:hypothetical protein CFP56_09197 [Quercus suber]
MFPTFEFHCCTASFCLSLRSASLISRGEILPLDIFSSRTCIGLAEEGQHCTYVSYERPGFLHVELLLGMPARLSTGWNGSVFPGLGRAYLTFMTSWDLASEAFGLVVGSSTSKMDAPRLKTHDLELLGVAHA